MELNKEYTYGDLARGILGEEPKKGNSKIKQMKQIKALYNVEQKGRKYILVEKYPILEAKTYKNYKELCGVMGWEVSGGNEKQRQIKYLQSICKYHKEGQKFVIEEVFLQQKEFIDGRTLKRKEFNQYKIPKEYDKSVGIYKITLDNKIYIGSTADCFRRRFTQHMSKSNQLVTKNMLEKGATFEILQICDGMKENEIRIIEQQWIEEYRNNPEWKVVNDHNAFVKKEESKYKTLKLLVTEEEGALLLEYLKNIRKE